MDSYDCSISHSKGLVGIKITKFGANLAHVTNNQKHKARELEHEAYLAMLMLDRANKTRFKGLNDVLDNNYEKRMTLNPLTAAQSCNR